MTTIVAAATMLYLTETASDWKAGAKDIIFICVFLLALIAAAIWWLRRG